MTRVLSSRRLSDDDIKVKVKSHSGGPLEDIHNSITKMAEDDDVSICAADVILIHAGTNNLSDGDTEENVTKQLHRITEITEDVNPFCKIIVSSILPHKNDRLGNQLIKKTNMSIEKLCRSKAYCFMENSQILLENGTPDPNLYKDNIHLNAKGGKNFGEAISHNIRELLKLPAKASAAHEQDFHSGRQSGRSLNTKNNNRNNDNQDSSRNYNNQNTNNNSKTSTRNNGNYRYRRNQNNNTHNNWNNNTHNNNRNNNWNKSNHNNINKNNSNNWNGMMLIPIPFLPPWFQQQSNQMTMNNM